MDMYRKRNPFGTYFPCCAWLLVNLLQPDQLLHQYTRSLLAQSDGCGAFSFRSSGLYPRFQHTSNVHTLQATHAFRDRRPTRVTNLNFNERSAGEKGKSEESTKHSCWHFCPAKPTFRHCLNMCTESSFASPTSTAMWVVEEVSVLLHGNLSTGQGLISSPKGTAHGITRRFVLRKEIRAPKTTQVHVSTDMYARFAMIFGRHEDTLTPPHKNKRLSVLDECEEDLEDGRKDTMYEEDWDITFLQSIIDNQALGQDIEQLGHKDPRTTRNSWKKRFSKSSHTANTCLGSSPTWSEKHDVPSLDRTIVKTVSHTAIFTNEPPIVYQHGPVDYKSASLDEPITISPLSTSLALERERIQRLFEDDLHQKRLELRREKYASPQYSHVIHGSNDGGLRRMAGDFDSRIKTLNDRITKLLMKHSHCRRIRT